MPIINPDDALGIAARDQAERRRWATFAQDGNFRGLDANMMAANWDGFLERLHQGGVTRMADTSVGQARGMFPRQAAAPAAPQTPGMQPPSLQALGNLGRKPMARPSKVRK
jgi:hypothetical protein